jgi:hypothetical protein
VADLAALGLVGSLIAATDLGGGGWLIGAAVAVVAIVFGWAVVAPSEVPIVRIERVVAAFRQSRRPSWRPSARPSRRSSRS